MEDVLICPECKAEFLPHVRQCNGCGVALVRPDNATSTNASEDEDVQLDMEKLACIDEGELNRVNEFSLVLKSNGIANSVFAKGPVGGSSCCSSGPGFGLYVEKSAVFVAHRVLEDYFKKLYPETLKTDQLLKDGLCPACSSKTKGLPECPECGLNLDGFVYDDECDEDDGDGGGCNKCY